MKQEIIRIAKENLADLVGFASASQFEKNDPIFKIFPQTKTVICLVFRVLRGIYRGTEEGTTYYQYTTMGVENMEETIMPMAQLKVANFIEKQGFVALPQRRHQQIMAQENSTNPEVAYDAVYRGRTAENQMDFASAAVACGVGEKGLSGAVLTDDFGPMVRYCFILTDAELEADPARAPHLCDNCGACVKACPKSVIELRNKGPRSIRVYVACINQEKGAVARKACQAACSGCGKCAKECTHEAINVANNLAYIDFTKCKLCKKCVEACPTGAIQAVNFPVKPVKKEENGTN